MSVHILYLNYNKFSFYLNVILDKLLKQLFKDSDMHSYHGFLQ